MVTVNLGNKAGNTANVNYTLSNGCSDSIITDMTSSVGWMAAIASNGTIRVSATEDNPGDERSGYITPVINGESCTNNRFMVTQEAGEEPEPTPTDCKCLVDNCEEPGDLHEAELEASAGITCDSAWANNPYNYGFDVTYSQSSGGPWTSKSGNDNWLRPVIVAKAGCNSGPTGQANYEYLENTTGSERWAKVHWFWDRDKEEGMCSESNAYFRQFGGETPPSEPCDVKLTLSGLEGTDKATINWGDGNSDNNVGNEQKTHTYSTGGRHTASITANGYKPVSAEFDCDGTTEISKTMEKGVEDCNCSDFTINSNLQFGASTNLTRTTTYTPTSCTPSVESKPSWITDVTALNGIISATAAANTGDYRNDYIYFKIDGTKCSNDPLGVSQYGAGGGGTIDKYMTIVMTTTPPIYMNSIQYKISLEPKEAGEGTAVTLHDYDWFINEPCTDNPVKWTNNLQKTIKLTGSYTGNINLYNFKVDFQNRTLKKQNTSTLQCDGSETTATGTMRGIGSDAVEMNASNGYFLAPLTSESNIGTSINIALRQKGT